ncbi:UNVERIFIED_ORG: hypothetical protein GGD51_003905 [Rhizobium esperanzae]|uniref:hypothetical protein n=1 Tax=Rhizobium phaseoli TaxID=396 RepID=UPI0011AE8CC7|nr:hypothetical protein [Rhizobium phaseoli]
MAAQAPAALNFRHDFNGWRVKEALIGGYRGVACGSVISSLRRAGTADEGISDRPAGVQNFNAQIYG